MPDSGTGEFAGLTGENGIHIDPDGEALLGTRLQDGLVRFRAISDS